MRALVMTEPSTSSDGTEVRDLPVPCPTAAQVTIDVSHAGINFIDVMARRGDPEYASTWPFVPGLEVAGRIREVGTDVTGLTVGQRVAAFTRGGGLAEVAVAEASLTVPLPGGLAMQAAAAAPLALSTALLLLTDVARIGPGESVLMHSASGGVGSAIPQLVRGLNGGLTIGTVGRAEKEPAARKSGWDVVLIRGHDLGHAVRAAMPQGIDVILDPSGTDLLDIDLEVAAPGGRIVLFGNPAGSQPAPLPPLGRLIGGNIAIAGFSISRLTATAPDRPAAALRRVLELLAGGQLSFEVSDAGPLEHVPSVHQILADGRGSGKYVASVAS